MQLNIFQPVIFNNLSRLFLLCKVDLTCAKQCSEFFKWSSNGRSISSCKMSETDFSLSLSLSTLFSCISSYLTPPCSYILWMDIVCVCELWALICITFIFVIAVDPDKYWGAFSFCIGMYLFGDACFFTFTLNSEQFLCGKVTWSRTEVEQHR